MIQDRTAGRTRLLYSWWIRELSQALTRRQTGERPWRTMLFKSADELQIFVKDDKGLTHLATLAENAAPAEVASMRRILIGKNIPTSKQVVLRLSQSEVVRKTIRVPKAASDLIDSIVENKIETIVPWAHENTYYGYRINPDTQHATDQIDTDIVATTKEIVDRALARANDIGISPRSVDFADAPEDLPVVELVSLEPDPISRTSRRLNAAIVILSLCTMSTFAFGGYQLWNRETQYSELEGQIESVMTRVEETQKLNEENNKIRDQRERLARRKIEHRPVMELIEALSRALPDTAYLEEFEIHDDEARIVGKAPDPTGLIGTLESTPEFEDVRFAAPTTREDGQTLGTFSIMGIVQKLEAAEHAQK